MKLNRQKFLAFFLFLSFVYFIVYLPEFHGISTTFSAARWPEQTLIIDPGHGGEDGGAIALSGCKESEINLEISLKLDQLCGLFGVHTLLLRTLDISLADNHAQTLREKKRSDLLTRVELINQTPNAVLLSIHQNHYQEQQYRGAQVFYRNDAESASWGEYTQNQLIEQLDPENTRMSKQIAKEIYLMNHINCRALLVECGFLSNPEDNKRLESKYYQHQLAAVLLTSYITYLPTDNGESSYEGKTALLLYNMWE